jgi:hypothetical protein
MDFNSPPGVESVSDGRTPSGESDGDYRPVRFRGALTKLAEVRGRITAMSSR